MRIEDIVRAKGTTVVTIPPDATVTQLLALLAEHNVGALVVSRDGRHIDGIVSERDVVRRLAATGPGVLDVVVSAIMTVAVKTCTLDDRIEDTAREMTYGRFRHLPVVAEDGSIKAIVSIGDVVKFRIDQLTDERNHLVSYLHK